MSGRRRNGNAVHVLEHCTRNALTHEAHGTLRLTHLRNTNQTYHQRLSTMRERKRETGKCEPLQTISERVDMKVGKTRPGQSQSKMGISFITIVWKCFVLPGV